MTSTITNIVKDLKVATGKVIQQGNEEYERYFSVSDELWNKQFSNLNDTLLGASQCKALSGDRVIIGTAFISTKYFSFVSNRGIRVVLPLVGVDNLIKAGKAKSQRATEYPSIVPITSPSQKTSVIQLFTNDGLVHSFYHFGTSYSRTWNLLNYVWSNSRTQLIQTQAPPPTYISMTQQQPHVQQPQMQQHAQSMQQPQLYPQVSNQMGSTNHYAQINPQMRDTPNTNPFVNARENPIPPSHQTVTTTQSAYSVRPAQYQEVGAWPVAQTTHYMPTTKSAPQINLMDTSVHSSATITQLQPARTM